MQNILLQLPIWILWLFLTAAGREERSFSKYICLPLPFYREDGRHFYPFIVQEKGLKSDLFRFACFAGEDPCGKSPLCHIVDLHCNGFRHFFAVFYKIDHTADDAIPFLKFCRTVDLVWRESRNIGFEFAIDLDGTIY